MSKEANLTVVERPEAEARQAGPSRVPPAAGLCDNCDHEADCAFRRAMDQPITFCDEWTCEEGGQDSIRATGTDGEETKQEAVPAEAEGRPRGLCMTCGVFETCLFPKPPDGVWHCEEYC